MKLSLCAALILSGSIFSTQAAAAQADPDGVRFDQHKTSDGFILVARGKIGLATETLRQAYRMKAQGLCAGATVFEPAPRTYPAIKGGMQFLMPAGGIFIPMTTPYQLEQAPALAGTVSCLGVRQEPEAPLRIAIESNLGNYISYVNVGVAFQRNQLEVPVTGPGFSEIGAIALVTALQERGYQVEVAAADAPAGTRVLIERSRNPGESFAGVVMKTNLNMLGIDEFSIAFCSVRIAAQTDDGGAPQLLGQLNTSEKIAPVYSSWKKQMADGPSAEINALSYGVLSRVVADDVRAAVHAMKPEEINHLVSHL